MLSNNWIVLGLVAAIFWGIYIVLLKFAVNPKHLNTSWPLAVFGLSLGILAVTICFQLFIGKSMIDATAVRSIGFWISVVAGVLWALGASAVLNALSGPETDASRLVVVFNLNTIIAVLAAIVLFKEIPSAESRLEVIIGAILVIIGAFLASRG